VLIFWAQRPIPMSMIGARFDMRVPITGVFFFESDWRAARRLC
jgi:hypothetical protein